MRFGFGAVPDGTVEEHVQLAIVGEELGFDMCWVPDQTFYSDPFVIMAASALQTSRIEFMLGVANPYTRHPVQVARAATTIDHLSLGRMCVGYGAGNGKELVLRMGDDHTRIVQRCREAVEVTKLLLQGHEVSRETETMHLAQVRLQTPPCPDVPVYLGGRSPGVLRVAGAVADGIVVGSLASPRGLAYALETAREGAAEVGRSLDGVEFVSWASVHLTSGGEGEVDFMKPIVANVIGGHATPVWVLEQAGLSSHRITELQTIYATEGKLRTAAALVDEEVRLFAHVGDAAWLRHRITELGEIGVGQVGILLQQRGFAARKAFLRAFAEQVLQPARKRAV